MCLTWDYAFDMKGTPSRLGVRYAMAARRRKRIGQKEEKSERFGMRIDDDIMDAIKRQAKDEGRSAAGLIKHVMTQYVTKGARPSSTALIHGVGRAQTDDE